MSLSPASLTATSRHSDTFYSESLILRALSKMSFSTNYTAYGFFPTAPSAPNAFALFASTQSPRDTYHMYEDARQTLCPSTERTAQRKQSKSSLKKFFGL
ncbi:hypothetical protein V8D89_009928 [Ganoderma adspersum]